MASECDYINAIIGLGGGGQFFVDDVIYSISATDFSDEEKEKNIEEFKKFSEYILSHEASNFSMGDHSFLYWKIMLSIDQQEVISKIDTPVLILQGGKDQSVSLEKTTQMVNELKQSGKSNIDYYFYPEYDHSLNFSMGDGSSEKIIADIRKWIQTKLSNGI